VCREAFFNLSKRDLLTKRTKRSEEIIIYVAAAPMKGEGCVIGSRGEDRDPKLKRKLIQNRATVDGVSISPEGEITERKGLVAHNDERAGIEAGPDHQHTTARP
jgi:hypothetical protein